VWHFVIGGRLTVPKDLMDVVCPAQPHDGNHQ
jgi:hypothetical protein